MVKSKLIKGLTLFSSTVLVGLFLLYRIGAFDHYFIAESELIQGSHNGGAVKSKFLIRDTTHMTMLSSSKVLIITDKRHRLFDSSRVRPRELTVPILDTRMLGSSKSAIIFSPKYSKRFRTDSFYIKSDTMNFKKATK